MHTMTPPPPISSPDATSPGERFRRAMGRIPTGVAVITGSLDGRWLGMTVGSLTHVSHHPPLVAFFAQRTSLTARDIRSAGRFGVNVLTRGQEAECYRFATSRGAKFDGLEVEVSTTGLPRLKGTALWAECAVESVFDAGDHIGLLGRVEAYEVPPLHEPPMAFYRSKVTYLDPASGRHVPTEPLHWW